MESTKTTLNKIALVSGVVSSLLYIAINIYVPTKYEGYSALSLTVSELSAIGAPTRQLWLFVVAPYPLLFALFGWGVFQSSTGRGALRAVGILIIAYGVFNVYWPPMHMRGSEPTLTDTLHIVWAVVTVCLMITMMSLGAASLGRQFRLYTIASIATHLAFGILTSIEAPNIPVNGPTPWIGLWERINIGVFMLWVIAFAIALLQLNPSIKKQPSS
jgi:hypothetical protein